MAADSQGTQFQIRTSVSMSGMSCGSGIYNMGLTGPATRYLPRFRCTNHLGVMMMIITTTTTMMMVRTTIRTRLVHEALNV